MVLNHILIKLRIGFIPSRYNHDRLPNTNMRVAPGLKNINLQDYNKKILMK